MGTNATPSLSQERIEKLRQIARRINENIGASGTLLLTAEELQAMMIAQGVNPNDNIGSRDILRARYPDDTTK